MLRPLNKKSALLAIAFLANGLCLSQAVATSTQSLASLHKLQAIQDSLAHGDKSALDSQTRLLSELGAQLKMSDEAFLEERQNFYTTLLYLIYGGDPEHVQHLLKNGPDSETDRQLIEGVLAYAEGREMDFHAALGGENLDDRTWSHALRASLYLALTPYMARKNPQLAEARLDYIRLVAPGSLFEEAALRRQIKIAAMREDKNKIATFVRHYTARFANSPYMRDFWAEVMEAISAMQPILTQEETETLLTPMPEKLRLIAHLQFARLALIDGRLEQAIWNAQAAEVLAYNQGENVTLARFYQIAAKAPTIEANQALVSLQEMTPENLPERDRALFLAVRNVAQSIGTNPINIDENIVQSMAIKQDARLQTDSFLQHIQAHIDEIDMLLEEKR